MDVTQDSDYPPAEQDQVVTPPADNAAPAEQDAPPESPAIVTPLIDATPPQNFDPFADVFAEGEEEEDDDADAPVDPPADTETGDKPESDPVVTEEDSAGLRRIMAKHGVDEKSANVILEYERKLSRQGNELGQLRKAIPASASVDNAASYSPVSAASPSSLVANPNGDTLTDALPGDDLNGADFYDPATWRHDEETGWPIDSDGDKVMPVDEWGIEYTPESRWEVRARELEDQYDSPTVALMKLQEEKQKDIARYQAESNAAWDKVRTTQYKRLQGMEPEIAKAYSQYEEPVAKAYANTIAVTAAAFFKQEVAANRMTRAEMKNPATMQGIVHHLRSQLYLTGNEPQVIEQIRTKLQGAKPIGSQGAVPPSGASHVAAPSQPAATATVSEKARKVAEQTGLTADEAERYNRKDFVIGFGEG